jgi:hypothetical protein
MGSFASLTGARLQRNASQSKGILWSLYWDCSGKEGALGHCRPTSGDPQPGLGIIAALHPARNCSLSVQLLLQSEPFCLRLLLRLCHL